MAERDNGAADCGDKGRRGEGDERRGVIPAGTIEEKPARLGSGGSEIEEEEVLRGAQFEAGGEDERGAEYGAPRPRYSGEEGMVRSRDSSNAKDGEVVGK